MGTYAVGKLQSGRVKKGQKVLIMPNSKQVSVDMILVDEEEAPTAQSGDNVKLKLRGCEEEDLAPGYVLCHRSDPCALGRYS